MRRTWTVGIAATLLMSTVPASIDVVASGASAPALTKVKCTPLTGDPQIEAPGYAQSKGANGSSDGWWCQLPHATEVPAGLVARRRFFIPAEHTTYGDYWTWYGPPSKGPKTRTAAPTPAVESVVVADLVYSEATPPKHLKHEQPVAGKRVRVRPGITGVESVKGTTVRLQFQFPVHGKGVPKYLTSVATVTVIGMKVSPSTVLSVAKRLKPL